MNEISVIIPAWQSSATIGRALASIAVQTMLPHEVMVVDDGSDDGTAEAAQAWREKLGPVALKVIRQDNQGAGAARNRAIAEASGSLLAFLDADDEWLPGKLEASIAALGNHLFVSHDMVVISGNDEIVFDCARHWRGATDPFLALFKRGFVATSTVVARREAVVEAGGFNESLRAAQDYDLWLRLAARGSYAVFSGPLTRYHINPHGITSNIDRRRRCSLAVLARNAPSLRGRRGALLALVARAAIIQYEAASAHGSFAKEILRAPLVLLWALGQVISLPRCWPIVWLAGATLAYMWQFGDMLGPILSRMREIL